MKQHTAGRLALALLGAGAVALSLVSSAAAAPPMTGSGGVDAGVPGTFVLATENGQAGRLVALTGVITGTNFEPGICDAGPADNQPCFTFTNTTPLPGQFERAHSGDTGFTYCSPCTVDGKTGSFTLKITYLPGGLTTNFTIQNAAGGLTGLQGQGTLDLTTFQYTLNYHFH
jgi:hypothetical protein